jgi:hypothetical protein
MAKYLVLYTSSESAEDVMAKATPEDQEAGMEAWAAWSRRAGNAVVDLGAPLQPASTIGDAPSADGITGYSLLESDGDPSVDELLEGHPHLQVPGNGIQVLELFEVPGM